MKRMPAFVDQRSNQKFQHACLAFSMAAILLLIATPPSHADVIFEEQFSGISTDNFVQFGLVNIGLEGIQLHGSSLSSEQGAILSLPIDTSNFGDLTLTYERSSSGFSGPDVAEAVVSIDGGDYVILESITDSETSNTVSFSLDNDASTINLRFSIDANSSLSTYNITSIVLEGTPIDPVTAEECKKGKKVKGCKASRRTDPGIEPWTLVNNVAAECKLDPNVLAQIDQAFNETYLIVRYGKLCHEHYPNGNDPSSHIFSTTKTLGATTIGALMYQTKDLVNTGRKTGPLTEFQRVEHWLDSFTYNPDATIAHVLSMEAHNPILAYPFKEHIYDATGDIQINSLSDIANAVIAQDPERLGSNIGEFYQAYIADKLGFQNSTWGTSDEEKTFGYSWNSTIRDMARVGLLLLNGGVWNGERILDAQYLYNQIHAAFEDGHPDYGYLTWLISDDPCAPAPVHKSYPHGISQAPSCLRSQGCAQTYDVGVFRGSGSEGQYILMHRGLDLVIVVKDYSGGTLAHAEIWEAIRPAVVAMDPNFNNDADFCDAYRAGDYAPDLKLWENGL